MPDTTIRDQLAAIIGARRWHTNEAGGQHAATADAILAAGWRPPARVIETAEDLAALPIGSLVGEIDETNRAWIRNVNPNTDAPDWADALDASTLCAIRPPVRVLWEPQQEDQR